MFHHIFIWICGQNNCFSIKLHLKKYCYTIIKLWVLAVLVRNVVVHFIYVYIKHRETKQYPKKHYRQCWKFFIDNFLTKSNIRNNVYRKLFKSFRKFHTLVLKVSAGFWIYRKIKLLMFEGDWNKLQTKIC